MYKLVLLRHGESIWNLENKFTGWTDVELSVNGIKEAKKSGQLLKQGGIKINQVYTSVLKRAIDTMRITLNEMNLKNIDSVHHWRLNERHYGALQGLNKLETAKKYGDDQVLIWRRSYDVKPPPLKENDHRHPSFDKKYLNINSANLPNSECLKDTVIRLMPFWQKTISPSILSGKLVLIVAHGNSLRALIKYLDKISDEEIIKLNIPTGSPIVYELDKKLNSIKHYYLYNHPKIK
jgi:2,3-bisphosphoglycerate-dependent phosphoglycerate mutase